MTALVSEGDVSMLLFSGVCTVRSLMIVMSDDILESGWSAGGGLSVAAALVGELTSDMSISTSTSGG